MSLRPAVTTAGPRLAEDLARLTALADGQPLPIGRVLATMEERGYALAFLLLAFPFVLPIPSLGMSAPIGLCLALASLTLIRGGQPSVPPFLERRAIAYPALKALHAASTASRPGSSAPGSAAADRWHEHDLVPLAQRRVEGRVAAIDGGGEPRPPAGQGRMVAGERLPGRLRRRARRQVQLDLGSADG